MDTPLTLRREMNEAIGVLKAGGVVALPTDTLYGLGADATSALAVGKVFEIKGRSKEMSLPLLLGDVEDLDRVADHIPKLAWDLAERFWPGPLTLILKKSAGVNSILTGGKPSIAVRMPDHLVPLTLIRELGRPITGTSANPSGGQDPITAGDVKRLLGEKVDYILDCGPATVGMPSTILDLTESRPRLVRLGAIDYETLRSEFSHSLQTS
jgi:L-threonylcarbamoyladenylate synthase